MTGPLGATLAFFAAAGSGVAVALRFLVARVAFGAAGASSDFFGRPGFLLTGASDIVLVCWSIETCRTWCNAPFSDSAALPAAFGLPRPLPVVVVGLVSGSVSFLAVTFAFVLAAARVVVFLTGASTSTSLVFLMYLTPATIYR
jgi:hypothetical protein